MRNWNIHSPIVLLAKAACFYFTYEELKQINIKPEYKEKISFYFTYEELKPKQEVRQQLESLGFYFTYEELKHNY